MDTFTLAYLETALWVEGLNNGVDDIDPDSLAVEVETCKLFQAANQADLANCPTEMSGCDLYLTRNRHGAGFWDRGLGAVGERLTDAAHALGESTLYLEDGKIYFTN